MGHHSGGVSYLPFGSATLISWKDDDLAEQISRLRFLVLDEADRMIETGHFAEMDNILRLTLRQTKSVFQLIAMYTEILMAWAQTGKTRSKLSQGSKLG